MTFQRKISRFLGVLTVGILTVVVGGCQSLNDDPRNDRCWFPSLTQPGHLNTAHERTTPEGSDPYPAAGIGPKSLQARPQYWDTPRNWNTDLNQSRPVSVVTKTE